jgi:hypothetical protein
MSNVSKPPGTGPRYSLWNTKLAGTVPGNHPPVPYIVAGPEGLNELYNIDPNIQNNVYSIISLREPYAQEELITRYGNLETKLGTNLGR